MSEYQSKHAVDDNSIIALASLMNEFLLKTQVLQYDLRLVHMYGASISISRR